MSTDRYDDITPVTIVDSVRGPVQALFTTYVYSPPAFTSFYTVQPGDRWDRIAHRIYGDPTLWWRIADMNPELFDPRALRPGTIIRVPSG
jgi:nucleoid-associated protein YgaU